MCDPVAQGAHHGYNAATQQRSNAAFFYCVGLWMVLSIAGCNQSHSIEAFSIASDMASHSKASPMFDAGIVLSDRSGYTCIPLDRIGLQPDAQIVRLDSSCECVKPRVVVYATPGSNSSRGILLEYVPEDLGNNLLQAAQATNHSPMLLGVIVQAHLADGTKREFSVDLLHTTLLDNTVSATTLNEVSP
jgi:hypothetical protein